MTISKRSVGGGEAISVIASGFMGRFPGKSKKKDPFEPPGKIVEFWEKLWIPGEPKMGLIFYEIAESKLELRMCVANREILSSQWQNCSL